MHNARPAFTKIGAPNTTPYCGESTRVWVQTPSKKAEALVARLTGLGREAHADRQPNTEIVLCDLLGQLPSHYPPPPELPTLPVLIGEKQEVLEALRLGYYGYVSATSGAQALETALEAVLRGEVWAGQRFLNLSRLGSGREAKER